ncbi:hypothetical protein EDB89DRAFT_2006560 [Lactarius sanguifluus]|nr:hypothetical protein EDB89DRAFT_2006560 [Lactarius sanguifluus]
MPVNPVAENIFGTMGAILWSVQLIPQLVKSWRAKSTKGLSPLLPLIWSMAALPLGIYVIVQDLNVPLIVQPQLFALFTLLSWTQCMYYGRAAHSRAWCATVLAGTLVLYAALEAGMVFALRVPLVQARHVRGQGRCALLWDLELGLDLPRRPHTTLPRSPQYYEIYKHGAVIGISLTFMAVDLLGGIASILSLAFKSHFDTTAAIAYALVVVRLV